MFFLCPGKIYQAFDVVAVAPYLSADLNTGPNNTLVTIDELYNSTIYNAVQSAYTMVNNIAQIVNASAPNMILATYEGGPDFSSLTDTGNTELTTFSYLIHRDERMYNGLLNYLGNLTQIPNFKIFNYFLSGGLWSKYGCWGIMESSNSDLQSSVKYRAYNDFIDSKKKCSWSEKQETCQNNCSNAGLCLQKTAISAQKDMCYCFFGHQLANNGTECQVSYIRSDKCTYQCGNRGVCEFDHLDGYYAIYACHCYEGYYGYGCDLFNCTNECNYNGLCVDRNNCSCYRGFKGTYHLN